MEHPHTSVSGCVSVTEPSASVRGAVVNEEQLPVLKSLCQYGLHTFGENSFRLVDGNDDGNDGHEVSSSLALNPNQDAAAVASVCRVDW